MNRLTQREGHISDGRAWTDRSDVTNPHASVHASLYPSLKTPVNM